MTASRPTKGALDLGNRAARNTTSGLPNSARRRLEFGEHPLDPRRELLGRHLFTEALDHQREGERRRAGQQAVDDPLAAHARERGAQPLELEFLLQDLALRLSAAACCRRRTCGTPRRTGSELACSCFIDFGAPGYPWKIRPATRATSRNRRSASSPAFRLASTSSSKRPHRSNASPRRCHAPIQSMSTGRQQFEAVVVDRDREGRRRALADPVGQQRRQPDVRVAAGERIDERCRPSRERIDSTTSVSTRRHHRPLGLQLDQRPRRAASPALRSAPPPPPRTAAARHRPFRSTAASWRPSSAAPRRCWRFAGRT